MNPAEDIYNKLKGCLVLGALGDALGSKYEGRYNNQYIDFELDGTVTDDTQLTLATCEAVGESDAVSPQKIADRFLKWFNAHRLSGLGASTLKAMKDLQVGSHWALAGRAGEYAAGNGAAMRIAPLAFKRNIDRQILRDVCSITHKNDEAYTGALAVYYSVQKALNGEWKGEQDLIDLIIGDLPDMLVKDRLIELAGLQNLSIMEVGQKFGSDAYVVNSVPLAIFAAQRIKKMSIEAIFIELIRLGGDTDTICSITGQIAGALLGYEEIPEELKTRYEIFPIKTIIDEVVEHWKA